MMQLQLQKMYATLYYMLTIVVVVVTASHEPLVLMKILDRWYNMSLLDHHINLLHTSFIVDCRQYTNRGLSGCYCNTHHLFPNSFYKDCIMWLQQAKQHPITVERRHSCVSDYYESHITARLHCEHAFPPYEYDWDTRSCRVEFTSELPYSISDGISCTIIFAVVNKILIIVLIRDIRKKPIEDSQRASCLIRRLQYVILAICSIQLYMIAYTLYRATWSSACSVQALQTLITDESYKTLRFYMICGDIFELLFYIAMISQVDKLKVK